VEFCWAILCANVLRNRIIPLALEAPRQTPVAAGLKASASRGEIG
jgi:hypothetical protein